MFVRAMVTMDAGHVLETALSSPPLSNEHAHRLAVLLHPWSWLGGRMSDPVLRSLVEPLHGLGFHVLLFNSRGVGKSTGRATWTGNGECDDLIELVRHTMANRLTDVQSLVIIGYSHGSMIASRFPVHPDVQTRHIILSYPLTYRSLLTLFSSSTYQDALEALVRDPVSDVLLVHGDRDDFTSIGAYNEWTTALQKKSQGKFKVTVVPEAGHFWAGQATDRLQAVVQSWLSVG